MEKNVICMDVPLFVRILEETREGVKSDAELHFLVDQILEQQASKSDVLTMDDYADITYYKTRFQFFADKIVEGGEED